MRIAAAAAGVEGAAEAADTDCIVAEVVVDTDYIVAEAVDQEEDRID